MTAPNDPAALLRAWTIAFILSVPIPSMALAKTQSLYSDLSDRACRVISRGEANYMVDQACPGILGYTLQKNVEDARDSITLVNAKEEQPLNFYDHVTETLNYLGDKAEWRVQDGKPVALIVRMYFENPQTQKKEQRLIVAKVRPRGSCVTQIIDASQAANANEQAREAADHAADQPCLWMIDAPALAGTYAFDRSNLADAKCRPVDKGMVEALTKNYVCETDPSGTFIGSCRSGQARQEYLFSRLQTDCENAIAVEKQ